MGHGGGLAMLHRFALCRGEGFGLAGAVTQRGGLALGDGEGAGQAAEAGLVAEHAGVGSAALDRGASGVGAAGHEGRGSRGGQLLLVEGDRILRDQSLGGAGSFAGRGRLDRAGCGHRLEGDFAALDDGCCDDRDGRDHVAGDRQVGDGALVDAGRRV